MTLDALLGLLDGVRPRGTGRWSARCPAHADKSPSLSIAEGDRGILIKCFAGCPTEDICRAIGITVRDLFTDSRPDPQAMRQRAQARHRRRRAHEIEGLAIDSLREAERFINSRRGLDISGWSDEQLNAELDALADAYSIMGEGDLDE